jgi:magnesium chelatase subunit D
MASEAHDDSLVRALACAAIAPGLRAVLVFDVSPERLLAIAATYERLLTRATGESVARVMLAATTDDDLWGAYGFGADGRPTWTPGVLAPREGSSSLIVVRDLAALGFEAMRTLVAMVGADVAHLERNGRGDRWRPPFAWLAGCARKDVGKISTHLLDRFALRLDGAIGDEAAASEGSRETLRSWLESADEPVGQEPPSLGTPLALRVEDAVGRTAHVDDEQLDQVLEIVAAAGGASSSLRRSVALARMAVAECRLQPGALVVSANHVLRAAARMGLVTDEIPPAAEEAPSPDPPAAAAEPPPANAAPPTQPQAEGPGVAAPPDPSIKAADTKTEIPMEDSSAIVLEPTGAFPEDSAGCDRERHSLAWPAMQRRCSVRAARGVVIGTEESQDLRDLAVVATLMRAAWHQAMRPRRRDGGLTLAATDLRRRRRIAPVERMFAMVIDYTSLAGWDWEAAVLPYLRAAYAQRASTCFVKVGARDARSDLRADLPVVSRSLLAAPLDKLFAAKPGHATPLAHGLALALDELRHALHHGRGTMVKAQIVVVTDGRGNLALEHSKANAVTGRIGDEGVRSALEQAQKIRALERLESIVLRPASCVSPGLVERLATAMGAELRKPVRPVDADA